MPTASYGLSFTAAGVSIQSSISRTGDAQTGIEVTLPVGKAGTLSTRTDDNTGICTLGTSHGITADDTVDVYWSGGRRYGVDVTAVDATTASIDLGAGDNLPTASTAVVVTKQVTINCAIDGDNVSIIGVQLYHTDSTVTAEGHATFKDGAADVIKELDLDANVAQIFDITGGATNVFTGDPIATIHATNGSSASAGTLKLAFIVDSTP